MSANDMKNEYLKITKKQGNTLGFEGKLLYHAVHLDIDAIKLLLKQDTELTCRIQTDLKMEDGNDYKVFYFDGYLLGGYDQHDMTYASYSAHEECNCLPPTHTSLSHLKFDYEGDVCTHSNGCNCKPYGQHKLDIDGEACSCLVEECNCEPYDMEWLSGYEFTPTGSKCPHDKREPTWEIWNGYWVNLDDTSEYHAWGLVEVLEDYFKHMDEMCVFELNNTDKKWTHNTYEK